MAPTPTITQGALLPLAAPVKLAGTPDVKEPVALAPTSVAVRVPEEYVLV